MSATTPPTETRNVIDYYWYWKTEAIKADLDTKRHPFAVLCVNVANDYNISGVVRNANAFLAEKVYLYGRKKWDRRGAVGTQNYTHFEHIPETDDLSALKEKYTLVGVDNVGDAEELDDFEWPERALMVFGQEQHGLSPDMLDMCDKKVYIKQYGSVRSLNVACASGIIMQDFCRKLSR